MKKLFLLFSILIFGLSAQALTFDGFIADQAKILSPNIKKEINEKALSMQERNKADIVIVTLNKKDLKLKPLSDVTLKIGRDFKIGSKDKSEGVIFAIVPRGDQGNRVRIEVGYGLEEVLTDGKCGRILDNYVMPYYEKGQYEKATQQAFIALNNELEAYYKNPQEYIHQNQQEEIFEIILIILILLFIFLIAATGSGGGPSGFSSGGFSGGGFSGGGFSGGSFGGGGGFGGGGCGR